MPSGTHSSAVPHRSRNADLQPPPVMTSHDADREPTKQNLASWWKNFKRGNQRREDEKSADIEPQGIFGVPLQMSVKLANVAISLYDNEGKSYIYGYVPIVVAKCGVFLKEKATDIEGIFRLSGSEKRIKELRAAFNTPERYGKGLDWTGYTVHDAANILRRYFNQLPEPIIPLEFYERFREPIRNHQPQAVGPMDGQSPSVGDFNPVTAIKTYQRLITELPALNRQLLLYILDLLAVFASKSDLNKMTTPNLSAIFQPGILSHPTHSMSPNEYRLSQDVLIFLIENQDHFLIGMQGTAADAQTVKDVESGPPTPSARTSSAKGKVLGRSGSAASKLSGIRRSVSVSSRQSRGSAAPSPLTPSTPGAQGLSPSIGVSRSNTVPSKRGSAAAGRRTYSGHPSEPSTPEVVTPPVDMQDFHTPSESLATPKAITPVAAAPSVLAPPQVISPSSSEDTTPIASPPITRASLANDSKTQLVSEATKQTTMEPTAQGPSRGSAFTNFLNLSKTAPTDRSEQRKPNKLQKKRAPSPANPSAQSSRTSVNLTDTDVSQSNASPLPSPGLQPAHLRTTSMSTPKGKESLAPIDRPVGSGSPALIGLNSAIAAAAPRSPSVAHSTSSRVGPNPEMSPANSLQSYSTTTGDELDRGFVPMTLDDITDRDLFETNPEKEKEKRRRWFSRGRASSGSSSGGPSTSQQALATGGLNEMAARSRTSFGSGTGGPATAPTSVPLFIESMETPTAENGPHGSAGGILESSGVSRAGGTDKSLTSSNEAESKEMQQKNPIKWIQHKIAERAEKREQREFERAKSPAADQTTFLGDPRSAAQAAVANSRDQPEANSRGKSFDIARSAFGRGDRGKSIDVPRQGSTAPRDAPQERNMRGRSREAASGARQALSKSRTRTTSINKSNVTSAAPTEPSTSTLAASKASATVEVQPVNGPDQPFRLDPAMAASVAAANVSQAKAEMRSASMTGPSPATVAATAAVGPSNSVPPLAVVATQPALAAIEPTPAANTEPADSELRNAVATVLAPTDPAVEKSSE